MSYERLRQPPEESAYVPIYDSEKINNLPSLTITIPDKDLLQDEYLAWRTVLRQACADELDLLSEISGQMTIDMRRLTAERLGVLDFLRHANGMSIEDVKPIVAWQSEVVALTGYSKMARDSRVMAMFGEVSRGKDVGSEASYFLDFDKADAIKTGMHVVDEYLDDMGFATVKPGDAVWYEGEEIFVRAARPAEPTLEVMRAHNQQVGYKLDRVALTSLSARIKTDYWLAHAVNTNDEE